MLHWCPRWFLVALRYNYIMFVHVFYHNTVHMCILIYVCIQIARRCIHICIVNLHFFARSQCVVFLNGYRNEIPSFLSQAVLYILGRSVWKATRNFSLSFRRNTAVLSVPIPLVLSSSVIISLINSIRSSTHLLSFIIVARWSALVSA